MQIVCPHCQTSYQVDASAVGATGRSVRCARCRTVWFAADTAALSEIAASHQAEMSQFAVPGEPDGNDGWLQPEDGPPAPEAALESQSPGPVEVGFVDDAPSIAAGDVAALDSEPGPDGSPEAAAPPVVQSPTLSATDDIETVAARRALEQARKRRFRWPLSWLPTAVLVLFALDAGLIGWRAEAVRLAPQTASLFAAVGLPVNLRGLVLADVTTEMLTDDGVQVLLVQGQILSTAKRTVEVPLLRFAARNGNRNEIYSWTVRPGRSLMSPGESLPFQSRLAAPPPETREVLVRFFNRRDLAAGMQ